MTKKRSTKRALFMSALSLLLCVSMLVGTTYAWFTDEVVSGMNTITAGNLDVELLADGKKVTTETKLFADATLWEPGVVVYENLQIVNAGTLALKYQMTLNFGNENHLNGNKLSDILKVAVLDTAIANGADRAEILAKAKAAANVGTLQNFYVGGELEAGDETAEQAVVIFWEPQANEIDNLYNANNGQKTSDEKPLRIEFGVNLVATQKMSEEDSFGDDYDKNAWADGFAVYTADDLQAAINNGEANITVMSDLVASETIVIPADKNVVINLNGKKLSGTMHKNDGAVIKNEGTLTLANGTVSSTANNGGSAIVNKGTAKVENVTLNGAPNADGSWPSYTVNNTGILEATNAKITSYHGAVASYGAGAVATLNNSEIDMAGIPGFTNHGIYTYDDGAVVVNGGTYVNKATDQNSTGGSVINGAVTVNAGSFSGRIENYYGTPVIKGGTFAVQPRANFIAAGYKAVAIDGKYVVVPEEVDGVTSVSDTPALIDAIKTAPTGEETMVLLADGTYAEDIDITVAALGASGGDVVIKAAEGANPVITGLVTLGYRNQGVGAAMYDANVTFEGITFDQAENAKHSIQVEDVKSLTLKNCTIIGDGEYGVGCARGNATGASKIIGCTFKNSSMQLLGNFATGLVIDGCTFDESRINVQGGNGVTVQNCKFENTLTAANVGDSFYAIRSNSTAITVKDCEFNVDSVLTEAATSQSKWYLLANRGTTNWTVENVAVTLTAAAQQQTELKITACTSTGLINTTNVTVNGVAL